MRIVGLSSVGRRSVVCNIASGIIYRVMTMHSSYSSICSPPAEGRKWFITRRCSSMVASTSFGPMRTRSSSKPPAVRWPSTSCEYMDLHDSHSSWAAEGGLLLGAMMDFLPGSAVTPAPSSHLIISGCGICTAKVAKWRCMRGVIWKEPAVGFKHAINWVLHTSFCKILCLSYLRINGRHLTPHSENMGKPTAPANSSRLGSVQTPSH